jgi:hypothetical protein
MAYTLLATSNLADFYPEYFDGVAPVNSYGLVSQLIRSELSPEAADFLAEPLKPVNENTIKWYTPLEGDIKTYESLLGEEKERAKDKLYGLMGDYSACSSRLLASGSSQKKLAGKLVSSLALSVAYVLAEVPSASKVYFLGNSPVITGWGLSLAPEASGEVLGRNLTEKENDRIQRVLSGERVLPVSPGTLPPAPETVAQPPTQPARPELTPPRPIPPAVVPAAASAGCLSSLLGIILTALGTALLLLLLAFLLYPGLWDSLFGPPATLGAWAERRDSEVALREERDGLLREYLTRVASCPPATAGAGEVIPPVIDPVPVVLPVDPDPVIKEGTLPVEPKLDDELVIPDDPVNLEFLEGCWVSDAGLVDYVSDLPVTYKYCFDGSGGAAIAVDQFDSNGKLNDTCRGSGRAAIDGSTLMIKDSGALCPNGPGYVPTTVVCEAAPEGKPAQCSVQSEGGDVLESFFTYAGRN